MTLSKNCIWSELERAHYKKKQLRRLQPWQLWVRYKMSPNSPWEEWEFYQSYFTKDIAEKQKSIRQSRVGLIAEWEIRGLK